ncbi:MAG: T9SS type A sorting domain-containing protein [Chitinophagales bacterium]
MKRFFTLIFTFFLCTQLGFGQVYLDGLDNNDVTFWNGAGSYSFSAANGEMTVQASNTGPFDTFVYQTNEEGSARTVDMTGNNKVFVRAKASNVGVQLRMDVQDKEGYVTSLAGITKTLTSTYQVLQFDFTSNYQDGGFGGTPCSSGPCVVDGSQIAQLLFYTQPGAGGYNGTVVIDYISFGQEPAAPVMSDVFQDHFDKENSLDGFSFLGQGYDAFLTGNSEVVIRGDGSTPEYDPFTYLFLNQTTGDTIDIDATAGNNKIFVKVKSTVPNTSLRIDLQDIDTYLTTQGSITKIVGTEYEVLEFDYTGSYADLGYGGSPCTENTAPCPVNGERIADMVMFINPGAGEFLGELTIDYISFGISLEPAGSGPELLYSDHFNNEMVEWSGDVGGFTLEETGSEWIITGDGTAPEYTSVTYILHDKEINSDIHLDLSPAKNKIFVRAKTDGASVPLRLDILDTLGYITSQTSLTKIINGNYATYEYDFTGGFFDGGYGGSPCEVGPCAVDPTIIRQLLLYIDPVQGGFAGKVYIDFVSIGQPLGDDNGPLGLAEYADQMDENTSLFVNETGGLTSSFAGDIWTISGDGTAGAYSPMVYNTHNELGELVMVNAVANDNKLFIKAKSSVEGTELRVDVQDNMTFVGNLNAVAKNLTTEYVVYEYDYSNSYLDGGYGGSPCTSDTAPCDVDGERINTLQFFLNAADGGFNGTVDIEWISFGRSLDVVVEPTGILNYNDEMDDNTLNSVSDMSGLVSSFAADEWTITGDGTAGAYSPVVYSLHNEAGEDVIADVVGSDDKLYIRAKSSVEGTQLRIDVQDNKMFVGNFNAVAKNLTTEYSVYEFDYSNSYLDGGYGGSDCTSDTAPCPVDGERIATLQLFFNAADGGFNGTASIDWISFGQPIVGIQDYTRLNSIIAYPNPAANELHLEYETLLSGHVDLIIYNAIGQIASTKDLGSHQIGKDLETIDLSDLSQGMYYLVVKMDGVNSGNLKFIKQ